MILILNEINISYLYTSFQLNGLRKNKVVVKLSILKDYTRVMKRLNA